MVGTGALWVPDRKDVIWIDHSPHAGVEMPGEHPMLVITGEIFNRRTGIVIGLPMTHAQSNEDNPFAIKVVKPDGGIAYILAHQPKSFDWRERKARPNSWSKIDDKSFKLACDELSEILAL